MALKPGQPMAGTKLDGVFVGSCTNSRIEDLRAAAAVLRGRKVAPHVTAWVVPGSERVKKEAEAEGLDAAFTAAGFEWREPGCALCVAANGEAVPPGAVSYTHLTLPTILRAQLLGVSCSHKKKNTHTTYNNR